jgi:hypothetical protein
MAGLIAEMLYPQMTQTTQMGRQKIVANPHSAALPQIQSQICRISAVGGSFPLSPMAPPSIIEIILRKDWSQV